MAHYDSPFTSLLPQIPLTVAPLVKLPHPPTLPYTYKPLTTMPPSSHLPPSPSDPPIPYVRSLKPPYTSGHPSSILSSAQELKEHIANMQARADEDLERLKKRIAEAELEERRRIAPGWLDSSEAILVPTRKGYGKSAGEAAGTTGDLMTEGTEGEREEREERERREGEDLESFVQALSLKEKKP